MLQHSVTPAQSHPEASSCLKEQITPYRPALMLHFRHHIVLHTYCLIDTSPYDMGIAGMAEILAHTIQIA
jgi:hypothetical protein